LAEASQSAEAVQHGIRAYEGAARLEADFFLFGSFSFFVNRLVAAYIFCLSVPIRAIIHKRG